MDSKITKTRISHLLSYDWVLIIVAILASIFLFNYIFDFALVEPTVGQSFKYFYDENMTVVNSEKFYNLISDKSTFSYDIKEISFETLSPDYNVLTTRLSIYEGDAIFTNDKQEDGKTTRAKSVVDNVDVYPLDELFNNAKVYLTQFLSDSFSGLTESEKLEKTLDYSNFDEDKIENYFNIRSSKERIYSNAVKYGEISGKDEIERIKLLVSTVKKASVIFKVDGSGNYVNEQLFFRYTRYEESYGPTLETPNSNYKELYEREVINGKENLIYGLNIGKLTGGKYNVSEITEVSGNNNAENVVVMIFDFTEQQPDLQYEGLSFIVRIVEEYSGLFSAE